MSEPSKECPECGSKNVVSIKYGYPGFGLAEDSRKGKVHLGGCMIEVGAPDKHCNDCNLDLNKEGVNNE